MSAERLHLEADLEVSVDGPGGHTSGRVRDHGDVLRVDVDRPHVLATGLARGGRGSLPEHLRDLGLGDLTVEVRGPKGRVAVWDPSTSSRWGALLTGDRHVHLERAGAGVLGRVALAWVVRRRVVIATVLGVGAAVLGSRAVSTRSAA